MSILMMSLLLAETPRSTRYVHLCLVLQSFVQYGMLINPHKCLLGVKELQFLGHFVNKDGVSSLPS